MANGESELPEGDWEEIAGEVENRLKRSDGVNPHARPEFRRSVREKFLDLENVSIKGTESDSNSSSRSEAGVRSDSDSMIEDILKELPAVNPARSEFRDSLKQAFLEGKIESRAEATGEASESVVSEGNVVSEDNVVYRGNPGLRKPHVLEGHWKEASASSLADSTGSSRRPEDARSQNSVSEGRRRRAQSGPTPLSTGAFSWQVVTGLAAVAAAVLLLVFGDLNNAVDSNQASWSIVAKGPEFEVDQVRLDTGDAPRLVKAVNNGSHQLASLGGFVELELARKLRLGMEPESRLSIPALGSQTKGTTVEGEQADELVFQLETGSLHLMAARDNPNQSFVVETPNAQVRIRGSVLSVEVFEGKGTCICVALGEANVEVLSGEHKVLQVGSDTTCFVFADDSTPLRGPSSEIVPEAHTANLLAFYDETF